jgi:cellobiose phosphorylase
MTEITTPTAEQIAQHYSAALDSVALINAGQPEGMDDADWADCLARNKEHLRIMLAKDFWTTEDLKPLQDASK